MDQRHRQRRQLEAPPDRCQQLIFEVFAQSLQRPTGRLLRDEETLSRTGDVLLLEERVKRLEQVEIEILQVDHYSIVLTSLDGGMTAFRRSCTQRLRSRVRGPTRHALGVAPSARCDGMKVTSSDQFGSGWSTLSMTNISTGPRLGSIFRPSCSSSAVGSGGPLTSTGGTSAPAGGN